MTHLKGPVTRGAKLLLAAGTATLFLLAAGTAASAHSPRPECTRDQAMSNFQDPFGQFLLLPVETRFACQYRLFFDGSTFTYCEDDVVLGGTILRLGYEKHGRAAEIARLESWELRVWLDGVEQPLMRTAYKNYDHPELGRIVYQQRGYIGQFSPGTHVSVEEDTFEGSTFIDTVILEILPRTHRACR